MRRKADLLGTHASQKEALEEEDGDRSGPPLLRRRTSQGYLLWRPHSTPISTQCQQALHHLLLLLLLLPLPASLDEVLFFSSLSLLARAKKACLLSLSFFKTRCHFPGGETSLLLATASFSFALSVQTEESSASVVRSPISLLSLSLLLVRTTNRERVSGKKGFLQGSGSSSSSRYSSTKKSADFASFSHGTL